MTKAIYTCLDSLGNKLTIKLPITTQVDQIMRMASTMYSCTILKVLDEQRCPDASQIGKVNVSREMPGGRCYRASRIVVKKQPRNNGKSNLSQIVSCNNYFDDFLADCF